MSYLKCVIVYTEKNARRHGFNIGSADIRAFSFEKRRGVMNSWSKELYGSIAWQKCRRDYLNSKLYICERCPCGVASEVHHIIKLTPKNINNADIALGWDNLEALCEYCHKAEHKPKREVRYVFDDSGNILPPITEQPGDIFPPEGDVNITLRERA